VVPAVVDVLVPPVLSCAITGLLNMSVLQTAKAPKNNLSFFMMQFLLNPTSLNQHAM
jgi:hypothetical protein